MTQTNVDPILKDSAPLDLDQNIALNERSKSVAVANGNIKLMRDNSDVDQNI